MRVSVLLHCDLSVLWCGAGRLTITSCHAPMPMLVQTLSMGITWWSLLSFLKRKKQFAKKRTTAIVAALHLQNASSKCNKHAQELGTTVKSSVENDVLNLSLCSLSANQNGFFPDLLASVIELSHASRGALHGSRLIHNLIHFLIRTEFLPISLTKSISRTCISALQPEKSRVPQMFLTSSMPELTGQASCLFLLESCTICDPFSHHDGLLCGAAHKKGMVWHKTHDVVATIAGSQGFFWGEKMEVSVCTISNFVGAQIFPVRKQRSRFFAGSTNDVTSGSQPISFAPFSRSCLSQHHTETFLSPKKNESRSWNCATCCCFQGGG